MIWTVSFWKGATERAIKSFFQAFVALIGVTAVGIGDVRWSYVLSGAALTALLSVATSIGNADFTAGVTPTPEPQKTVISE